MKRKIVIAPVILLFLCAMMSSTVQKRRLPRIRKSTKSITSLFKRKPQTTPADPAGTRNALIQQFERAPKDTVINFKIAEKKIIGGLRSMNDIESKAIAQGFEICSKNLLSLINTCNIKMKVLQTKLMATWRENIQIKQQQIEMEKKTQKVPEDVKELQERLQLSQATVQKQENVTKKIVAQAQELPALENIKKRTLEELGKRALNKMIEDKPLALSDIDTKAHLFKLIDAITFDPATGAFSTKIAEQKPISEQAIEEPSAEQEGVQIKLGLAKALQENEELKKQLDEQKQLASAQDITPEEKDLQLVQLKQELKETKEKYAQLEQQKTQIGLGTGIAGASAMSYIMNRLQIRFSFLFGNNAANILLDMQQEPNINALASAINKNTPLMQRVLNN